MFENASFIKPAGLRPEAYTGHNHAPMFRRRFFLKTTRQARLYVCGLGYGYFYINGKSVTEDLFTAPVSDYTMTLWYQAYDVSELLQEGENVLAVWCGNGWYNEDFRTSWDFDKAPWRDVPKFILQLDVADEQVLVSDGSWKCKADSAIWYNNLRSGEYFDASHYEENWNALDFDDAQWEQAALDDRAPTGEFRLCTCQPIREDRVLSALEVRKTGETTWVYDFGQNISGYVLLKTAGEKGQELTIRYSEQLKEDGSRELNRMTVHYLDGSPFQTDKFVCSGKNMCWSPRFAYHGFRYIEVEGIRDPAQISVQAVFVHQAVEARTEFTCSDDFLNRLFRAGQYSTWSNLFYQVTDCPTREKLGWANDAQASAEQMLTNFKVETLFEKWLQDVYDAMREDGALPGIIPSSGWGYEWGNGPVSDGILFELPYRIWLHTGNPQPLIRSLPYFRRYLAFLKTREDPEGFVHFGLDDWARPGQSTPWEAHPVPLELINGLLIQNFYDITAMAQRLAGESDADTLSRREWYRQQVARRYLLPDGKSAVNEQSAVAMLIYYDLYKDIAPLKAQLKQLVEERDFHHTCGMVGLRRLYMALNKCGLEEYAYRILTVEGYPGCREWFAQGATTLWEYWDWQLHGDSKNHQMYSDFMSWIVKTILGIRQREPGFAAVEVRPYFFRELDFAKGSCDTCGGKIAVAWERTNGGVLLRVDVPEGMDVTYGGRSLAAGHHEIEEKKG